MTCPSVSPTPTPLASKPPSPQPAPSPPPRHVYALAWGHWERWCTERGLVALPGDPFALAAYLTERAEAGRSIATLDVACTVIRHVHRAAAGGAAEDPVASEIVGQVRRGLRRTYGVTPRRLARPLTVEELRQIIDAIDRTTVIGIRDAAMILLGYASALRRAALVALTLADIEHKPTSLLLTIRQSKMDQEGHGALVAVAHGRQARHRPGRRAQRLAPTARRGAAHAYIRPLQALATTSSTSLGL